MKTNLQATYNFEAIRIQDAFRNRKYRRVNIIERKNKEKNQQEEAKQKEGARLKKQVRF